MSHAATLKLVAPLTDKQVNHDFKASRSMVARKVAGDRARAQTVLRDALAIERGVPAVFAAPAAPGKLADQLVWTVGWSLLCKLGLDGLARLFEELRDQDSSGSAQRIGEIARRHHHPASRPPVDDVQTLAGESPAVARPDDAAHARRVAEATELAVARGDGRVTAVLAQPGILSAEAFGQRLGVTRNTVNRWKHDGKILALGSAKRGDHYPEWQIVDGQLLPGLDRLVAVSKDRPWSAHRIMTTAQPELKGATGLEECRRGGLDMVISMVEGVAESFS